MYEYFVGQVTQINPGFLVLDVNGIGYRLLVGNPYRYQEGETTTIYIYQAIRENDMSLFGFYDQAEKELFEHLIKVSGIGPKSALAILANADQIGLVNAIEQDDLTYLTKFPGVGKKTAQQIILDLKGKMTPIDGSKQVSAVATDDGFLQTDSTAFKESVEALSALGYSQRELSRILPALRATELTNTDAYLRQGLALLMGK